MKVVLFLLTAALLLLYPRTTFASSPYVLPYPGEMPGSRLYVVQDGMDVASGYWYFGSYGQFKYNLKQADKYLVEAKTLFEYNQYLLGYTALNKSDAYFQKIPQYLQKAESEGRDVREKRKLLQEAALKHQEVLEKLQKELPETFTWTPEKKAATELDLEKEIEEAIKVRTESSGHQVIKS